MNTYRIVLELLIAFAFGFIVVTAALAHPTHDKHCHVNHERCH